MKMTINGKVVFDGTLTDNDKINIETEKTTKDDFYWVNINQFECGTQGTLNTIDRIYTQVFESQVEYSSRVGCVYFPISLVKYQWISYRGMKYRVTKWSADREYSVELPDEKILREHIKENNIPVSKEYAAMIKAQTKG